MTEIPVRRALLSVFDKTDLAQFARTLASLDIQLLSTGGTHRLLDEAGLAVTEVSEYTGFPEMMDGRVKTLHPKIHGGLLGRRGGADSADAGLFDKQSSDEKPSDEKPSDEKIMAEYGIDAIDLLVVNLYPFEAAVASAPGNLARAIENIDIGGPAMLRSAAKNFRGVCVIVDTADYQVVAQELQQSGGSISLETRFRLAVKAFDRVAGYDAAIANYLSAFDLDSGELAEYPASLTLQFNRKQVMRYGENPHQSAAYYTDAVFYDGIDGRITPHDNPGLSRAVQLQGKAMSYNNVADTDAALACVQGFESPACVIVKHANPCGVAEADDIQQAYRLAFSTDSTSAFGGIIAFNRVLEEPLAREIIKQQFVEVILAPELSDAAAKALTVRKNIRVLMIPGFATDTPDAKDYKRVAGGLLVQSRDDALLDSRQLKVVTGRAPSEDEHRDLLFAWKVARFVKSNAIVYARNRMTIGIGAGQMSRVDSAKLAILKAESAGLAVTGSVMASDAFFPFRDGIDAAAAAGVSAVIQPGGSMRDQEVIDAADEAGLAMIFTGMRHFRH